MNTFILGIYFLFVLYQIYEEVQLWTFRFRCRRNNAKITRVEIIDSEQLHDAPILYCVAPLDCSTTESYQLKTTLMSSFVPRLLGRSFRVIIHEKECIVYSPIPFLVALMIILFQLYMLYQLSIQTE
jgi:hypothetical protein